MGAVGLRRRVRLIDEMRATRGQPTRRWPRLGAMRRRVDHPARNARPERHSVTGLLAAIRDHTGAPVAPTRRAGTEIWLLLRKLGRR